MKKTHRFAFQWFKVSFERNSVRVIMKQCRKIHRNPEYARRTTQTQKISRRAGAVKLAQPSIEGIKAIQKYNP